MDKVPILARRLKEARLRAGISQMALGVAAGIDEFSASPRINQYERGKHTPDLKTVARLAKALDVTVPYFFAEDDEMAELLAHWKNLSATARKKFVRLARKNK